MVHIRANKDINEAGGMEWKSYIENEMRWLSNGLALGMCCTVKNLAFISGSWEIISKSLESPKQ